MSKEKEAEEGTPPPVKQEQLNGLRRDRSCTDVIFLIIFLLFVGGQIVLSALSISHGDPKILVHATNTAGDVCGVKGLEKRDDLLIYDITQCVKLGPAAILASGCPTTTICVEDCPSENWSWYNLHKAEIDTGERKPERRKAEMRCVKDFHPEASELSVKNIIDQKLCAPYYLKSNNFLKRCIPDINSTDTGTIKTPEGETVYTAEMKSLNYQELTGSLKIFLQFFRLTQKIYQILGYISRIWYVILGLIGVGAVLSLIYCFLLRYFSGVMVYTTLSVFLVGFMSASGFCYYNWYFVATLSSKTPVITLDFSTYLQLKEFWLTIAILLTIISFILIILVVFSISRIRIAVALIGYASKAIDKMLTLLVLPILPLVLELATLLLFFIVVVYIMASKKMVFDQSNLDQVSSNIYTADSTVIHKHFLKYVSTDWSYLMHVYNLFVCVWMLLFFDGLMKVSLAGAICAWYWARDKTQVGLAEPFKSNWRCVRYHLGTIAFGSLLVAIVVTIKHIIQYLQVKAQAAGINNAFAKFVLCCCHCFFLCLEKVLKFINRNAFIMTAMNGENFCSAAKSAFFLILRNCVRLLVLDNVTAFVLFTAKLVITAGCGVMSYFVLEREIVAGLELQEAKTAFMAVTIGIIVVGTYIASSLFFSLFSFTVDTLFLCLMQDLENNDGSPERPYFMNKKLMSALCVKNKF